MSPYVLDGRTLEPASRHGLEVIFRVNADDLSWALMNLGQYVQGTHAGQLVRAYVYSLTADAVNGNLLTLLIEKPKPDYCANCVNRCENQHGPCVWPGHGCAEESLT